MQRFLKTLLSTANKGLSLVNHTTDIPSHRSVSNHSLISQAAVHATSEGLATQQEHNARQQLINGYHKTATEMAHSGIADGVQGIPAANSSHHSHAEKSIIANHANAAEKIKLLYEEERQEVHSHIKEHNQQLQGDSLQIRQGHIEQAEHLAEHEASQHVPLVSRDLSLWHTILTQRTVLGVTSALQEKLHHIKEEKAHYDTRHEHLLTHHYHRLPPLKRLVDIPVVFRGLVGVLFTLEIGANFKAFQAVGLGDMNIIAILFGVMLALFQALSAKELGFVYFNKEKKKIALYAVITLVLCGFISGFRWSLGNGLFLTLAYISINFLIAIATTLIAHAHAKHHDFFFSLRKRHKAAARIKQLEYQMTQIEAEYQKRKKERGLNIRHQAHQEEHAVKEAIKQQIRQYESHLLKLNTHEKHGLHQLETIKHQALATYRELNKNARKTAGHASVQRWQNHESPHVSMIAKVASFLLFLCIGFSSCHSPMEPTHIEVMYDVTGENAHQDIDAMVHYIMSHVPIDTVHGKWGATTITLSHIGETSIPVTHAIHLPANEHFLWRNELEHKQHPHHFKAELRHTLQKLTKPSPQMDHSYIHRNFHYRLHHLAKQKGHRLVLTWSDLILNHPPVNFYDYRSNPALLHEKKDSLIQVMTHDYPLPDLSGIALVNIHHPVKLNDALHEECKHLFAHYWQNHGMQVEFKTVIPHYQNMSAFHHRKKTKRDESHPH